MLTCKRVNISVCASFIMAVAVIGLAVTGIMSGEAMVGDEVTHYYMLVKQSEDLSRPNFLAHIPNNYGSPDVRRYPHTFAWHYAGAIMFRLFGDSFTSVQIYHVLFYLQLLVVAFLLARSRGGIKDGSALLYLFVVASIPMAVLFGVTFYQDVPLAAQILTAFWLLNIGHTVLSMPFMILAILMKETAILFLPVYFLAMICWDWKKKSRFITFINAMIFIVLMAEVMLVMQIMMKTYAHGDYYPYAVLKKFYYSVVQDKIMPKAMPDTSGALSNTALGQVTPYEVEIIANHPGDLRNIKNYFIYGGILIWLVTFIGFVIKIAGKKTSEADAKKPSSFWLWGVGVFYLVVCGYLIRTAPDARFFLPALPFILLPLCENVVQIKFRRQMLVVFSAIALLQYGAVLTKTFSLRNVSDAMVEGMNYLQENKPSCSRVFMYPEGNYRLFPCSHEWYLGYKLREFWKADNDTRIQMLKNYHVGAIVVKKHLISSVDEKITNLGVYPDYFVKGLENDDRFKLVFDNSAVAIYTF